MYFPLSRLNCFYYYYHYYKRFSAGIFHRFLLRQEVSLNLSNGFQANNHVTGRILRRGFSLDRKRQNYLMMFRRCRWAASFESRLHLFRAKQLFSMLEYQKFGILVRNCCFRFRFFYIQKIRRTVKAINIHEEITYLYKNILWM